VARGAGRLELTWVNKDMRLLAHGADTYEWVDPLDWRVSEVRLLRQIEHVGDPKARDGLVIQGDSLFALTSLLTIPEHRRRYVGKVKLCYIDSPFGTGQTFAHYEDSLEHSVWLTMFRDRVEAIKRLLSPQGSLWVHLDDNEAHRARCVLDEVFGPDRFVATIVWEKSPGAKGDTDIATSHDYIFVYAMDKPGFKEVRNLLDRTDKQLRRYANPDNDSRGPWRQGADGTAKSGSEDNRWPITTPSGRVVQPVQGRYWAFSKKTFDKALAENRVYFGKNGDSLPVIKTYLSSAKPGTVPVTWWPSSQVGSNQEARRDHLRKLFPEIEPFSTPKPERLLARIIEIATNPGDLCLDAFAGSGSLGATALKLGRRFLMVEASESTVDEHLLPRLNKVVAGEDPFGITKTTIEEPATELPEGVTLEEAKAAAKVMSELADAGAFSDIEGLKEDVLDDVLRATRAAARAKKTVIENWKGGGGFDYMQVGPSMFEDHDGTIVLADWATGGELAEAVAAQLGYELETDGPFCGRKGRSHLAVLEGMLTKGVADFLVAQLEERETVIVVARALEPGVSEYLRSVRGGSRARKIPRDLAHIGRQPSQLVTLNEKVGS
jgi:adenine-specific DNA-methyltransferase